MMKNDDRALIIKVCCDVFEQLAFLFAEEIDMDEAESSSESFYQAFMTFTGEQKGSVDIVVPSELTQNLAYNILGTDPTDGLAPGTAEDALKELLNTICGRILTSLYGDMAVFDLSVPQTISLSLEQFKSLAETSDYITFDVESNPVFFRIVF